mmetsp:Transcript_4586/g.9748  ORF Transcript_4586/g.9748 Transcript_4586/m.9748 type:complete len:85 (+) Transcript_4586:869-1123(+)
MAPSGGHPQTASENGGHELQQHTSQQRINQAGGFLNAYIVASIANRTNTCRDAPFCDGRLQLTTTASEFSERRTKPFVAILDTN